MLLCRCIRQQYATASPSPVSSTNSLFWRLPSRLDSLSRLMCSNTWWGSRGRRRQAPGGSQRSTPHAHVVTHANHLCLVVVAFRQYSKRQAGPQQTHVPIQLASTPSASGKLVQPTHPARVAQTRVKGSCKVGEEPQAVAHRHACIQGPAPAGSVGAAAARGSVPQASRAAAHALVSCSPSATPLSCNNPGS